MDGARGVAWMGVVMGVVMGTGLAVAALTPSARSAQRAALARTEAITFEGACAPGPSITVALLGDLLLHAGIQRELYAIPEGAQALFENLRPFVNAVDFAFLNQETLLSCCADSAGATRADPGRAYDGRVYSSHAERGVNAAPFVAHELAAAGIDGVTTANNHAFDRAHHGVNATLDALDDAGLLHTGTRRDPSEPWHTVVERDGVRLALLACTQWTNGPLDDPEAVRFCEHGALSLYDDIAFLLASGEADGVIVLPHGGRARSAAPERDLVDFAHGALDAGALAVLINHRHVVQPWEKVTTRDGREGLIVYALGDLTADRVGMDEITSVMVTLEVGLDTQGRAALRAARAVPVLYPPKGSPAPRVLEVLDERTRRVEERALVRSRLPSENVVGTVAKLLAPACGAREFGAPRFIGSVGDGCDVAAACGAGLRCNRRFHDGMCTRRCTSDADCAAASGRARGVCAPDPRGTRVCLAACTAPGRCRAGFACTQLAGASARTCSPLTW